MREPDVDKMLGSLTSSQLNEWMGYEQASGMLGDGYIASVLAAIQDWIQQLTILTAQDQNAKVHPFPRPHEMYELAKKQALQAQREQAAEEA